MQNSDFNTLLDQYLTGDLTAAERKELADMVDMPENQALLEQFVESILVTGKYADESDPGIDIKRRLQAILGASIMTQERRSPTIHRVDFLRRGFFRYAAAGLVAAGLGTVAYLWTTSKKADQTLVSDNKQLQKDILPGGPKAVLTLADGSIINLDSAASGQLAIQGNARVIKSANGQIVYDLKGLSGKDVLWNTMSTPVGGQYQVTLPDGTKVWLNAASSITYPAAFVDKERKVKVTGEVYFEVARNKAKPFKVDIDGKSSIEVLGTSFNVNSYADEANIKTTLVNGSVKVIKGDQNIVLTPGQQAQITTDITVETDPDVNQTLAWKNGLFSFNNADLPSAMRQLERWYDIKVKYEGKVSNITIDGEMFRNVKLSDVLEFFEESGIRFKMEGKTLIVL